MMQWEFSGGIGVGRAGVRILSIWPRRCPGQGVLVCLVFLFALHVWLPGILTVNTCCYVTFHDIVFYPSGYLQLESLHNLAMLLIGSCHVTSTFMPITVILCEGGRGNRFVLKICQCFIVFTFSNVSYMSSIQIKWDISRTYCGYGT